jgi:hypothetical protein
VHHAVLEQPLRQRTDFLKGRTNMAVQNESSQSSFTKSLGIGLRPVT